MSETTTTVEASSETSADEAQLVDTTADAAEVSTEETHTDQVGTDETVDAKAETDTDPDLEWLAKSKGVDINDPKAVANAWRKAESEFHKTRQEASTTKLRDSAKAATSTGDELTDKVQQLTINNEIRDFNDALRDSGLKKSEIEDINGEMAELLEKKPHLARDLNDAYAIVKTARLEAQLKTATATGRKQAKTELAKSSVAGAPQGNASEATDTSTDEDHFLKGFNQTT